MVIVGIVFTPLQIILGDASGLEVAKNEPTKSAAMEAHWDTNRPGEGAPWVVIAWPDQSAQKNSWEITIPDGLSVLNTRSLKGQVEGLRAFPVNDQPPVVLPFYAFRLMVLLGIVMVVLILAALWLWIRKKLRSETTYREPLFLAGLGVGDTDWFYCHLVRLDSAGGRPTAMGDLWSDADQRWSVPEHRHRPCNCQSHPFHRGLRGIVWRLYIFYPPHPDAGA